jgi:hypothetical protein
VRFDNLFDDLSSQLEHELSLEELELRVEEERVRFGRLTMRDRLRCAVEGDASRALRIVVADGTTLRVCATTFGRDWLAGDLAAEAEGGGAGGGFTRIVVPLDAVSSCALDSSQLARSLVAEDASDRNAVPRLVDRLGFAFALRDLARRRSSVMVTTCGGVLQGTIDRVARDHLDLAVHAAGSPRRATNVRETRIVPLAAVLHVRA